MQVRGHQREGTCCCWHKGQVGTLPVPLFLPSSNAVHFAVHLEIGAAHDLGPHKDGNCQ